MLRLDSLPLNSTLVAASAVGKHSLSTVDIASKSFIVAVLIIISLTLPSVIAKTFHEITIHRDKPESRYNPTFWPIIRKSIFKDKKNAP